METSKNKLLARRTLGFWTLGIVLVLLLAFLIAAPFFALSGAYGVALFIAIPFSIGILIAFARAFWGKATFGDILSVAVFPIVILLLGLLFIGKEGFICILMALPIAILPFLIGVWIGYKIQNRVWSKYLVVVIVLFCNISAHVFDRIDLSPETNEITTSIVVDSSPREVWKRITSPFIFGEAKNFFFRNGVSYPVSMQVVTKNGVHFLNCVYTNGTTSATIQELVENKEMKFRFPTPQVTMKETSFYGAVEPKHIRGKIWASFGAFRLVPSGEGNVEIIATTKYVNGLGPKFYWKLWSEYLIDEMHLHVLEKIKFDLEKIENKNE